MLSKLYQSVSNRMAKIPWIKLTWTSNALENFLSQDMLTELTVWMRIISIMTPNDTWRMIQYVPITSRIINSSFKRVKSGGYTFSFAIHKHFFFIQDETSTLKWNNQYYFWSKKVRITRHAWFVWVLLFFSNFFFAGILTEVWLVRVWLSVAVWRSRRWSRAKSSWERTVYGERNKDDKAESLQRLAHSQGLVADYAPRDSCWCRGHILSLSFLIVVCLYLFDSATPLSVYLFLLKS